MEQISCNESAYETDWMELLYFELVSSILSCISSVIGGLLVFLIVVKNPQKRFHTSVSALLVTMATSALLVGITAEPLFIYFSVTTINTVDDHVPHDAPFLQFAILVSFMSSMLTLLTLVGITVNRYLFVSVPGWCMVCVTFNRTLLATGLGWMISVSYPFLYFNTGLSRYCIVHSTAGVFFITLALVYTFVWILSKLEALRERGHLNIVSQEAYISQNHSWLLVFSLGCYIPALIMVIIAELCSSCTCQAKAWLARSSFVVARLHCAILPVLYIAILTDYRSAIKSILFKCRIQGKKIRFNSIHRSEREINCFEMNGKHSTKI
ncbi:trace amine-associated receptor 9-like [Actinia tenebrosa]|uniref:Trace amine-associated receptor 9-like n=1 Tax=Actinia tenebrosa TaxID=6105 RepID=A0A6P8H2N1_ACTTE|nr:trace amine-associated receptor 9-like [Actinia tenebrosa]